MKKSKKELLESLEKMKLTPIQKLRISNLKNVSDQNENKNQYSEINQGLDDIASKINRRSHSNQESQPNDKYEGKLKENKFHKPSETKLFLSLFNNSEGLKYLTHRFNGDKPEHTAFIELCKKEFDDAKNEYPNVPNGILRRIEEFAFKESPNWFIRKEGEKIKYNSGWSKPEFVEWFETNNLHPASDKRWKKEMIDPFKESVEIRAGKLSRIIDEALIEGLYVSYDSFIIHKDEMELNKAEFYTNVDKFQHVLVRVFQTIKDIADNNFCFDIDISFKKEGKYKIVQITHKNSEPTKVANDPDFAKGDLNEIKNNMWGLGDYEIAAKFSDGYRKRIFLTEDKNLYHKYVKTNQSIEIDEVPGFSHILKFL